MKTKLTLAFLILLMCFVQQSVAQVNDNTLVASDTAYTFETIEVPGVDFLSVTASSDFEDYAGYTKSPDGQKDIAFTLIDGVFMTYDFPGAKNTYFYALGNDGRAAGHYEDSNGLHRGIILEDGELQQYDFPGAVQTEIWGISDTTGALTGNFIDAEGIRRGFSGDEIIEFPGATTTYADFKTALGNIVGSYIDAEGRYYVFLRAPDGNYVSFNPPIPNAAELEYIFVHGIHDAGIVVLRSKVGGDIWRSYVSSPDAAYELQFPGSVSTEGWNINQDGSVVGYYDTADGRRHGFIARPASVDEPVVEPSAINYTFETIEVSGVDFLAVTASSDFEDYAGYTRLADGGKEVGFTLIDGVFKTYDFPGSEKTHFYALANDGKTAGHYQDSDGLFHGVILENGELRQYDFPGAVQTFIDGISDVTGALTGNFIDGAGIRRGFVGESIVEFPGASETYVGFVNAEGIIVGSYVDAEGIYRVYFRSETGHYTVPDPSSSTAGLEYLYVRDVRGISDTRSLVVSKVVADVARTYVINNNELYELRFPGSVSTEGWNINPDGSVVGYYDTPDGQRRSFIAKPVVPAVEPIDTYDIPIASHYTFERIEVPGVDYLELTASSDFGDYAGNTKGANGKTVGFTLIDGVFETWDFPGAKHTYFYALGNDGQAAGHYEDSEGLYHGVILENGELRQYDFPGAAQTFIYGISDVTGDLTGDYIDNVGVRRGFSGDTSIEFPGASATYAYFVNASGTLVGSYTDSDGKFYLYIRDAAGQFIPLDFPTLISTSEYFYPQGINDVGDTVLRAKAVDDVPRTYIVSLQHGLHELRFPGSVSTEGWNINQDSSVVGYYDTPDGQRHSFIARPAVDSTPQVNIEPVAAATDSKYTFETIEVLGVDFLALTASSDFEDYAGYTKSSDGQKMVAFTLIDGIFMTYDFPGAKNTYFYALGNNGNAAGHYEDSEGLYHGVILENGELREYDFPGSVQTEIYGISDATGALTGNFTDASGIRRGFTGDKIIEFPGASETFADFVSGDRLVGSYVDAEGIYHAYVLDSVRGYRSVDLQNAANLEYIFFHGINSAGIYVARAKQVGDVPRTYIGTFRGREELQFPGSSSTEGYNINQDGSVVGHYETADGRRHGFIARPVAQVDDEPVATPTSFSYTFESIDVPGVAFLELTASSDFEDYAGNTRNPDSKKVVGWTLTDGVFMTYDFPGSKNTYFYALGNDGRAAGHYEDSEGLYHGVILENGELRQYDFPGSVQTEIYGISDATGALTGNFTDASGIRRGFTGDEIIEFPGASETFADFVAAGRLVGSYVDAEGKYRAYIRNSDGRFTSFDISEALDLEYVFFHGINNAGIYVARSKQVGDVPRTYVGTFHGAAELQFPGSVSTEGYNINQDGSVVGHYESADGRTHGFIARPVAEAVSDHFGNVYNVTLSKGLNMLSVPLASPTSMTAKSLAGITGATVVIALDAENQRFIGWTPSAPNDGFPIEGGQGYIVNVPQARNFAFVGSRWTNQTEAAAAPAITPLTKGDRRLAKEAWAFVVSGNLEGKAAFDGYKVIVRNLRTNSRITAATQGNYFAAATADLAQRSVVQVGDVLELRVIGPDGNVESQNLTFKVMPENIANAVLSVKLDSIGKPNRNQLLPNYPNPFNPETWIPYQLSQDSPVSVSIYDTTGKLIRTLSLGFQSAGFYNSRARAAHWDGKNALGEPVASGVYFYTLRAGEFTATRKMLIRK